MRIVCFHLNQIGDLAFSLPALKCIRDSIPDARITSVVRPGAIELMESTGLADEVLSRGSRIDWSKAKLARDLISRGFDAAVVFSQSAECALLAYLSRARRRIGFVDTTLGVLLTERLPFKHPPSTENNMRLVEALGGRGSVRASIGGGSDGASTSHSSLRQDYVGLLKASSSMRDRADKLLADHGIGPGESVVALSPGTSGRRQLKLWTDHGFAAVGCHLSGKGVRVVVLGTTPVPGIVQDCTEIIDLSGQTDLGTAAGILARCETLVAVDSGMLHVAAALGKRVVGLYGPSDPCVTGPQGEGHAVLSSGADCAPCGQGECKLNRKCMTDLDPSVVIEAVDRVLYTNQPGNAAAVDQS